MCYTGTDNPKKSDPFETVVSKNIPSEIDLSQQSQGNTTTQLARPPTSHQIHYPNQIVYPAQVHPIVRPQVPLPPKPIYPINNPVLLTIPPPQIYSSATTITSPKYTSATTIASQGSTPQPFVKPGYSQFR